MELQSLLFFHFIHNSQSQPVDQAYVCWRIYSGDYWKNIISFIILQIYQLSNVLLYCELLFVLREDEYLVNMQHTVIPSWYQREGYIKAMANLIEKELKSFDSPDEVQHFVNV